MATEFLAHKKPMPFAILERSQYFFLSFRKYSENPDCKKDGLVACAETGMAVQIPAQVSTGSLGQLFYLPHISQFHLYNLEITVLSRLGNALTLVRYLDTVIGELGKTCVQSNYKSPKR